MKKKSIAILVATTLIMTSLVGLTGCKKDEPTQETTKKIEQFKGTKVYKSVNGKIGTLNPQISKTGDESDMINNMISTFYEEQLDEKKEVKVYPTMAEAEPTISEDGLTITYKLRKGLKFQDGTEIDADTYLYSYKMLLDPVMKNTRGEQMFNTLEIVGAKDYYLGKGKWEEVGIAVKDKYTIEFKVMKKLPELKTKALSNGWGRYLVNPKLFAEGLSADKKTTTYGTSLEKIKGSCYGPYVMTEWKPDQFYKFEKNKDFVIADKYTPDELEYRVIDDSSATLQLFENKDVDVTALSASAFDKYKEDPRVKYGKAANVGLLLVNGKSKTAPILQDINMRKAIYYGLDREKLAKDVVKVASPAAYHITELYYTKIDEKTVTYRSTDAAKKVIPKNNGFDKELAKEYFNKAYTANGSKKVVITENYVSEDEKRTAEFRKAQYEEMFGADKLEYKLQAIPRQTWEKKLLGVEYELITMGWNGGLLYDPVSKLAAYKTKDNNMKADSFDNKEFDDLYDKCTIGDLRFDEKGKLEAVAKMEQMLLDDASIIPTTQSKSMRMYSDKLILPIDEYDGRVGFGVFQSIFTR